MKRYEVFSRAAGGPLVSSAVVAEDEAGAYSVLDRQYPKGCPFCSANQRINHPEPWPAKEWAELKEIP